MKSIWDLFGCHFHINHNDKIDYNRFKQQSMSLEINALMVGSHLTIRFLSEKIFSIFSLTRKKTFFSPDLNTTTSIKRQVDDVSAQQSGFSDLFHTIAEQIATQQDWMLGDEFTEILELINDEEHKRIVTIDNIFSVG